MTIEVVFQILGAVLITFYVMWLWLQKEKRENKELAAQLMMEQEARVKELKEMLPLLGSTSKGLIEVINGNNNRTEEIVDEIKKHMDTKTIEILNKCK